MSASPTFGDLESLVADASMPTRGYRTMGQGGSSRRADVAASGGSRSWRRGRGSLPRGLSDSLDSASSHWSDVGAADQCQEYRSPPSIRPKASISASD